MSIIVKLQTELDRIPLDTNEQIYIEFGTCNNPAIVRNKYRNAVIVRGNSAVKAWDNSSVRAYNNSSVAAYDNSVVRAYNNSSVVAYDNSSVEVRDNSSVRAYNNSSVEAYDNSSVEAWDNSSVEVGGNSSVEAYDNSSIEAWGNSSVEAYNNSFVRALGNSSVVAYGNSSIEVWDNSSVVAWGNSSVEALGNSSVEAYGNVQVVDKQFFEGSIQILGNARKVCMPKNIKEFMNLYGIKHGKRTAIFYKAVHKQDDEYVSDFNRNFKYEISKLITEPECSVDITDVCGKGIHISHLNGALNYGSNWKNLAILELEVKIKDIVMPINSDGKVRTSKVKVIREVPLSECGLYGKILERRNGSEER